MSDYGIKYGKGPSYDRAGLSWNDITHGGYKELYRIKAQELGEGKIVVPPKTTDVNSKTNMDPKSIKIGLKHHLGQLNTILKALNSGNNQKEINGGAYGQKIVIKG